MLPPYWGCGWQMTAPAVAPAGTDQAPVERDVADRECGPPLPWRSCYAALRRSQGYA